MRGELARPTLAHALSSLRLGVDEMFCNEKRCTTAGRDAVKEMRIIKYDRTLCVR